MAKSASSNSNNVPSFQAPRYQPHWAVFSLCLLFGLLLSVAFIDFSPLQSVQSTTHPTDKNLVGRFGAEFSWWAFHVIGISAWLVPTFLLWMAYVAIRNARRLAGTRILAMLLCIAAASGLASMFEGYEKTDYFSEGLGGMLGSLIYQSLLKDTLGVFGTGLLLVMIYALGLMFIFTKDISAEFEKFTHGFSAWRESRAKLRAERADVKRMAKEALARPKAAPVIVGAPVAKKLSIASRGTTPPMGTRAPFPPDEKPEGFADTPPKKISAASAAAALPDLVTKPAALPAPAATKAGKGTVSPFTDQSPLATSTKALEVNTAGRIELNIVKPDEPKKATKATVPQSLDENYERPPFSLLREPVKSHASNSEDEHRRNAENLLRILSEFGVEVTLGEIHAGPVITCYEVIPAPGVRVEKIAGLDKNIALGMRAQSVRILAPIPGKAAVGVEVPNQNSTPVGMRELLESEDWADAVARTELPIALGKDVSGKVLISDLTKMPHLLIAGATGSGKSVCINSIVASILYSKSPKDVRMIMVDPKIVELKIFNTLPHMLIPVVTEPKKVPSALKWLLAEMEQRYQIFAKVGVRNITGFNARKKAAAPEVPPAEVQASLEGVALPDDEIEIPARLPYIVAIIDELADLMMVAPAEIETSIARLAQLARAAGIHLIIATQRPSVNVITGVIKANLPSRIAFQVASQVDSRTILDTKGADTLIGRGDMLFSPPGTSRLVRAQGAFVSDDEVQSLVDFLKRNGPPQYAQDVQAQIDRDPDADEDDADGGDDEGGDGDDALLKQAIGVLKSTRRASTSMLQRRLRIGYNRAARLMEEMEDKGIVGPENGSSPRDILVDLDKL
ncbi:cell division protein FtsK [Nibricoccus aquaticus]|uniref:Cell division protein FtsK n=1 Tax=Nibricoccus aquaticus TaxID=2576891 RepID=A0A290Q6H8_9BACT|nr:DNA translocase FtsK [Nibricoccus aquaticus]ATC64259.1 cell division protein FtsK [Nibricoccus aquaticus]